ncbi:RICIN domain-containing protein [Promicromonospora sp. CA-289599]|uniref:RICIN domain-containing protein n=1 Tax=Promicromonospora sp. CA-289599 TaxID=3240014 RepID=UPI003D8CE484
MNRTPRRLVTTLAAMTLVWASALVSPTPASAATSTYYASPSGSGTGCASSAPCSISQVKTAVRQNQSSASPTDVVVVLAGGRYELSSPLSFTAADGGRTTTTVRWTAAPGATPVLTGSTTVTGWSSHDSAKNIWVASTPVGQDTRDLFVNGVASPRASMTIARSDIRMTATGFNITNPALNYLSNLPQKNRLELRSIGHFTDRYSPVSTINGTTATMTQPAWNNNLWGYDTMQAPIFGGHGLSIENSLSFISQPGHWYIDPSAGRLYLKPANGVHPSSLDVQLPRLERLIDISGNYSSPVRNLSFEGLQLSGTSWLAPSGPNGYAVQQTGTYLAGSYSYYPSDAITSCSQGCAAFERARTTWNQSPAAVQVSAATGVSFIGNRFVNLGQTALGIGNDANAHASGVGLGASDIDVVGNVFTQLGGGAVVAGGVRADAHHPSDPAMTNSDILIQANTVTKTSFTYRENSGFLSTYVDNARILQNEVFDLPYDAIDIGFGWGTNDAGGSQDYVDRGYYQHNPRYSTSTTFRNNVVANNMVHDTKRIFSDGGGIYSLSASPGTVIRENYMYNLRNTVGLYLDEGSRYITATNNVIRDSSPWVFANTGGTRNTKDNTVDNTWHMGGAVQGDFSAGTNNRITNDHPVTGSTWPAAAQTIICNAGVPAEYRTPLNAPGCATQGGTQIVGAPSGRCMEVPGSSTSNGAQTQLWDCTGGANQSWTYTPNKQLVVHGNKCLDASGQGTSNGTATVIWDCNGQANQQWNLNPNGTITGVQSGLCLDASGYGTANGTKLHLWACHGGTNQQWSRR